MAMIEEWMIRFPEISIVIFGAVVTFISTLLMRYFTDQEHLKGLKMRQKDLKNQISQCRKQNNFSKIEELNKEMIELSMSLMKSSFSIKQMLITIIPFIILFQWLRGIFIPVLGNWWLAWYIGSAVVFSMIYKKLLKMA